jgi:hypothetical protein
MASLAEATEVSGESDIRLEMTEPRHCFPPMAAHESAAQDWLRHQVLADGSVHMCDDDIFEAVVSADGRHVLCARRGDADERSFGAFVLNFAVAASLTLRGEEPLHATVLDLSGGAIGLLGGSGAGKSTLAACLIARGARLVTDDMLRLTFVDDRVLAHPGPCRLKLFREPAQRLLPAATADGAFAEVNGKMLVRPHTDDRPSRAPRCLCALFLLSGADTADGIRVRRLAGLDLARTLVASAMDIRYRFPDRLVRQMRFAEQLGRLLPVHVLSYPHDYAVLDRVADVIIETVSG